MMSTTPTNPLFEFFLTTYKASQQWNKESLIDFFVHAPQMYTAWWSSLLKNAPEHLVIETALCAFILWLVFIRKTVDPAKSSKNESLSNKEVDWLIETWQPEPLVPVTLCEKDAIIADGKMVSFGMMLDSKKDHNFNFYFHALDH